MKVRVHDKAEPDILVEPNSAGQGVHVEVRALTHKVRHVKLVPKPVPEGVKSLPSLCFDYYTVPVEFSLQTDDGAIDGRWETMLRRYDKDDPDPNIEDEDREDRDFDRFSLWITEPQFAMQGTLIASVPKFQQELDEADSTKSEYYIYLSHDGKSNVVASLHLRWFATRVVKKSKKHPGKNVMSTASRGGVVYAFE